MPKSATLGMNSPSRRIQLSVGWSKLCQKTFPESSPSLRIRLPVFRSSATVELEDMEVALVDQTGCLASSRRTRLPSPEMESSEAAALRSGAALLATHTGNLPVLPGEKKPSSKTPPWETKVLSPARGRPAEMEIKIVKGGHKNSHAVDHMSQREEDLRPPIIL
ncbi:unnamed protein product [Spirodela intermedia]|uniref:Uncharacterized protein n=1 Tax=Spirodela intermedia TaxID=51605 RepID=A0A7I8KAG3_SPIIN|nr:unnamed protein product [Spirodela intermedia]